MNTTFSELLLLLSSYFGLCWAQDFPVHEGKDVLQSREGMTFVHSNSTSCQPELPELHLGLGIGAGLCCQPLEAGEVLIPSSVSTFFFSFFFCLWQREHFCLLLFFGGVAGSSAKDLPSGSRVPPREIEVLVFQICNLDVCSATCLFPSCAQSCVHLLGSFILQLCLSVKPFQQLVPL